jgi:hypothetical protein
LSRNIGTKLQTTFLLIYVNGLAAAGPKAFSVFSGRTAPDPQDKWGIAGSRVSSGVTCP